MTGLKRESCRWPPQCCVPAFVHAALLMHGVTIAHPDVLPGILGVRVRPDDDNPLSLPAADAENPPGVAAARADATINRLLRDLATPLRSRRIPFSHVSLGLWEDVLDAALSRSITVGLGLDYGVLIGRLNDRSAQHVLRVVERIPRALHLFDDSGESTPSSFTVDLDRVERAALAISDGFWMIGPAQELDLPGTLPWTAPDE